jgi:hypothetical protein
MSWQRTNILLVLLNILGALKLLPLRAPKISGPALAAGDIGEAMMSTRLADSHHAVAS